MLNSRISLLSLLTLFGVWISLNAQSVRTLSLQETGFTDGLAVNSDGILFASNSDAGQVIRVESDGSSSLLALGQVVPRGLALDTFGRLYIADAQGQQILRLQSNGIVVPFAVGIEDPGALTINRSTGELYVTQPTINAVSRIDAAGNVVQLVAEAGLSEPSAIAFDVERNSIYVGNRINGVVFRLSLDGTLEPIGGIPGANGSHSVGGIAVVGASVFVTSVEGNRVYRLNIATGEASPFAGSGAAGNQNADLESSAFSSPKSIAANSDGTRLYVSDEANGSIRYISGHYDPYVRTVSTLPLSRTVRFDGFVFDGEGNIWAAEGWQGRLLYRIRPDGFVSAVSSGFDSPIIPAIDSQGNVYASNFLGNSVTRMRPDGSVGQFGTTAFGPSGCVVDARDNLYVAHFGVNGSPNGNTIYRFSPEGERDTFATGEILRGPVGMAFDETGNLYSGNILGGEIVKLTPGGTQSLLANVPGPENANKIGHLAYSDGYLYATGYGHPSVAGTNQVFKVSILDGRVDVIAGDGLAGPLDGPAMEAQFRRPNGVAIAHGGKHIFIGEGSETHTGFRVISSEIPLGVGQVGSFLKHSSGANDALALDDQGNLYATDFFGGNAMAPTGSRIQKLNRYSMHFEFAGALSQPRGIAVMSDGIVIVAESATGDVVSIDQEGNKSLLANGLDAPSGILSLENGDILVAETGLELDGNRIIRISSSGEVSDYASGNGIMAPVGMAVDEVGAVYVSSAISGSIYRISEEGEVTLFAEIQDRTALGYLAYGRGVLYAAGLDSNRVYSIESETGSVGVLAGNGFAGRENGRFDIASFVGPRGVVYSESDHTLYVSESNGGIRKLHLN
jgi:sugar lactone lactonase YvrE